MHPHRLSSVDLDGTITDERPLLTSEKRFNPQAYIAIRKQTILANYDLLAMHALLGSGINILTGKGANAWPIAQYVRERILYMAELMGVGDQKFADGILRSVTNPAKEVFFTCSIGNGGISMDMMRDEVIIHKPIPLSAW